MPLVTPLRADHSQDVARVATLFASTLGFPPNSVLTMQRRPEIAKAFTQLNRAVMDNGGRVTSEQKRLIGHLASANAGYRYCEAHTALAAKRFGASDGRRAALCQFRSSALFSAAEKAAFEFALAASSVPNAVGKHGG
jgi:alkylhydroperoxidase family enzyme